VVVASWGGGYQRAQREAYWKPFQEETGIRVIEAKARSTRASTRRSTQADLSGTWSPRAQRPSSSSALPTLSQLTINGSPMRTRRSQMN
jgi:putative spermidine/putrescine transport system substrate-binding protein